MAQDIFSSKANFRHCFEQGLVNLLNQDGLGSFILVLANATFDQHVHDYTEKALLTRYQELSKYYKHALSEGFILKESEDDVLVFLKILAIGIENIRLTEFRQEPPWELQFNHMRSLRPARVSQHQFEGTDLPFNPEGFNFNKPFLQKESFWQGDYAGKDLAIFYNKFPFARFHSLLVPDRQAQMNQLLSQDYHRYIWDFTEHFGDNLPGLGLAYNSLGAFSSVNHLHFHLFIKDHPLPIMTHHWQHHGGKDRYPLDAHAFDNFAQSWQFIDELNQKHIPYNLFYSPNQVICVPRQHQNQVKAPKWSSGFAWYEIGGGFTTFNHDDFNQLDAEQLAKQLGKLAIELS